MCARFFLPSTVQCTIFRGVRRVETHELNHHYSCVFCMRAGPEPPLRPGTRAPSVCDSHKYLFGAPDRRPFSSPNP